MKKILGSFIIPLVLFSLAVFAAPKGVGAQVVTIIALSASPSVIAGDTYGIYIIPASTSRTFSFTASSTNGEVRIPSTFSLQTWRTSSNGSVPNISTSTYYLSATPSVIAGDTKEYFSIPAGLVRTFVFVVTAGKDSVYLGSNQLLPTPPITVISPKGGEVFKTGQQMDVSWTTGGGSSTEYVGLILRKTDTPSNFPADSGNQAQRVVNDGSHTWTIGNNLELGQYILRIVCEPVSGCPMVDSNVFTIATSTPPTIPCYTFTINLAIGSRDTNGSKNVENLQNFLLSKGFAIGTLTLTSTLDKGYFGYATYAALKSYQTSIGLSPTGYFGPETRQIVNSSCGGVQPQPKPVVISPNGGEFVFGSTTPNNLIVKWSYASTSPIVDISIINAGSLNPVPGFTFKNVSQTTYGISIVPGAMADGTYLVKVCAAGTILCNQSKEVFNFRSAYAYVKVLTPNGGETFVKGSSYTIKWQSTGLDTVNVNLLSSTNKNTIVASIPASTGQYTWTVPTSAVNGSDYTVAVGWGHVGDVSDQKFTIAPQGTVAQTPYSVNVFARVGGKEVTSANAGSCVSNIQGPSGAGNTAGCVRGVTSQTPGTYQVQWYGGYPVGADTSKKPTITPSYPQSLGDRPAGENPITFFIDFQPATTVTPPVTPTTFSGNVNVVTRLNGVVLNSTQAAGCVSTVKNMTNGASNTAGCVRSLSNQPAGTYMIGWENGYPAGADTTKKPVISPVRFLGERPAGENPVTLYIDFAPATASTIPANIVASLDSSSPASSIIAVSSTQETENVVLGVFDIKSQNSSSVLNTLKFNIGANKPVPTIFSDIKIKIGATMYSTVTAPLASVVTFSNLSVPLPADATIQVVVYGRVVKNIGNVLGTAQAAVALLANGANIVAVDATQKPVTVTVSTPTSNAMSFRSADVVSVSNTSVVLGTAISNPNSATTTYPVTFKFTVNAGTDPIYLLSNENMIVRSVTPGNIATPIISIESVPSTLAGDGSNYRIIPAGASRDFVITMKVSGLRGAMGTVKITQINYGMSPSNAWGSSITQGLEALQVSPSFAYGTPTFQAASLWDAVKSYFGF